MAVKLTEQISFNTRGSKLKSMRFNFIKMISYLAICPFIRQLQITSLVEISVELRRKKRQRGERRRKPNRNLEGKCWRNSRIASATRSSRVLPQTMSNYAATDTFHINCKKPFIYLTMLNCQVIARLIIL